MFLVHRLQPLKPTRTRPKGGRSSHMLTKRSPLWAQSAAFFLGHPAMVMAAAQGATEGQCHRCPDPAPVLPKLPPWAPQPHKGPGTTAAVAPSICQGQAVGWARHTSGPRYCLDSRQCLQHCEDPQVLPAAHHCSRSWPRDQNHSPFPGEGHLLRLLQLTAPPTGALSPHRRHSLVSGRAVHPEEGVGNPKITQPQSLPYEFPHPTRKFERTHMQNLK